MNQNLESRIQQRVAGLHQRFERRVSLAAFVGCWLLVAGTVVSFPPAALPVGSPRWWLLLALGAPAAAFAMTFILRIAMAPFVDGYYRLTRLAVHTHRAVGQVLGELLESRATGYLETARDLLRTYQPPPYMVAPEAREAFKKLLDAGCAQEALDLGERLGLPADVLNQARRRLFATWESVTEEAKEVQEVRKAAEAVLAVHEAIEGLVAGLIAGELAAPGDVVKLLDGYASRLGPLDPWPSQALARFLPAATLSRVARTHALLGQAYAFGGERYLGRHHLERAAELDPSGRQTRLLLSRVYYDQENYPMALATIEAHLARFQDDLVAKLHRDDCLRRLGR
ncbi:MAG: hypothetical protein HY814_06140 [Candidatus Riflebacteria bacterium]|nr:hypothetical protein [Candidatus Riflebacteria bacterium]